MGVTGQAIVALRPTAAHSVPFCPQPPTMNLIVSPPPLHHAFHSPSSQETLFGRTVTPAERLRQHQRSLTKAQRELDRERTKLEQSEKKLILDIKKSAKAGQLVRSGALLFHWYEVQLLSRMRVKSWQRTL